MPSQPAGGAQQRHPRSDPGIGGEAASCMSRARMKLDPGERLLVAARPHPALLIPALLRALGVLAAAAVVHPLTV